MQKVAEVYEAFKVADKTYFPGSAQQCRLLLGNSHNVLPLPPHPLAPMFVDLYRKPNPRSPSPHIPSFVSCVLTP